MAHLKAPAKINLRLKVLGRRSDSYHDLDTVMVALDLCDDIEVSESPAFQFMSNWPHLALDRSNTVVKALQWWSKRCRSPADHLRIDLTKRIPLGAGLGGGSSDAGALLRWLAGRDGVVFGAEEWIDMARSVGADVPFFARGVSTARIGGLGERVEPLEGLPEIKVLLVKPPVSVSTAWAYAEFDRRAASAIPHSPPFDEIPPTPLYQRGGKGGIFSLKTLEDLDSILENDLEPVVIARYPEIGEAKKALRTLGARVAMMTGSGSTVFGIFGDERQGKEAMVRLGEDHPEWQTVWAHAID